MASGGLNMLSEWPWIGRVDNEEKRPGSQSRIKTWPKCSWSNSARPGGCHLGGRWAKHVPARRGATEWRRRCKAHVASSLVGSGACTRL